MTQATITSLQLSYASCVIVESMMTTYYFSKKTQLMMTSWNENIFRVTGPLWGEPPVTDGFPSQRPVMWSFDVFFDLHLNKRLIKQSRRWRFEAACWCGFVYVGSVSELPPLTAIITASHPGMLATRRCRRSTGIYAHLSGRVWWSLPIV